MRSELFQKFSTKIQAAYGMSADNASREAEQILNSCPEKLLPNIREWTEGKPLSDIYIEGFSVPMIMYMWRSRDFLMAISVMTELLQGDADKAKRQIWNTRR